MDPSAGKARVMPSAAFPFEYAHVNVDGFKISYVEAGSGDPVLFIHGNPTSSYLWRNILRKVACDAGRRSIALDLLGFGKSDKPYNVKYSIRQHADIIEGFIDRLNLKKVVFVLHDWGGPIGAAYAVNHPENTQGIALMESFVWPLTWKDFGRHALTFKLFRSPLGYILIQVMNVFVNKILPGAALRKENISEEVMRHYREPFPPIGSRGGIRAFPQLLPIAGKPADSDVFIEELQLKLHRLKVPVLWITATPGIVLSRDTEYHLHILRQRLPQLIIKDFGPGLHYLQEDDPDKIADLIVSWMHQSKLTGTKTALASTSGAKQAA